ncbi:MAG TPA: PAS domain S-box protein [Candidatus Acidoferrales bacterium]|nr:PAS domain S-box protein [Candidatus Acidoferrales bacterium]
MKNATIDKPEQDNRLASLQVAALEAAANPIIITQRNGLIIWVNTAFEQLSGYSREEAVGRTTRLLRSGHQPESFYKDLWTTILSGRQWRGELLNRRKDGSLYPEEMTITPVKDSCGDITHFIAIKLDITERKRAEERICRLAQIVENSADLMATADADGRITFANHALLSATGYLPEELIGQPFRTALISKSNSPDLGDEIQNKTISDCEWRGECFCQRKDGSDFQISLSTGQIKDNQGSVLGIFGIAQDVTERKRLENQLIASQKMEAVGVLAGGIAHDFNNLLGVILGYGDLALDGTSAEDPKSQYLQQIKQAGIRATSLTRQLLAFSRKQIFQPRIIDVNALVAEFNKLLRRMLGEDIELISTTNPVVGHVKADPGQIEQVLMNLAINARDAMPTGGKLIIETADIILQEQYCGTHPAVSPGRYVLIAVSDTGMGMDAKTQARIFEPFFTTKEKGKGTGLGLSTVYGVVKQSEGYIWVYSEVGKGTTFKIYLPRADEPASPLPEPSSGSKIPRGSETILLVEDAEPLRALTCALLRKNGYTVFDAANGTDAIEVAEREQQRIHLLLTDVVMPGLSGREVANYLSLKRPAMRVLYMSGYTNDVIVHHGVLDSGISLLEKPFSEANLARKLRDVLDAP